MAKSLQGPSIVIVCEGSTTELKYLEDFIKIAVAKGHLRKDEVLLIPVPSDVENAKIEASKSKKKNSKLRHLMGDRAELRYYIQKETTKEEYDKYCTQPVRYVREAQLFIINDLFKEGWAVYDLDHHSGHHNVETLVNSDPRLNVAFSAYSIEEWILINFERNSKAFTKSDCVQKDLKGHEISVGCNMTKGCKGEQCVSSIIRGHNHIPDFDKNGRGYHLYALDQEYNLKEQPLINAAWLRWKSEYKKWSPCNPYTDFDLLLLRLMSDNRIFTWIKSNSSYKIENNSEIKISYTDNELIISNIGHKVIFIPARHIFRSDNDGKPIEAINGQSYRLEPNQEIKIENRGDFFRIEIENHIVIIQCNTD